MQKKFAENHLDNLFLEAPVGIITVDSDLVITNTNNTSLQFGLSTAITTSELVGQNIAFLQLLKNSKTENDLQELKKGIAFESEITSRLTLDGNEITVILKAAPYLQDGIFKGAIFIIEDFKVPLTLTPDKVIRNELFNNFVKSISDYFLISSNQGEIVYAPTLNSHDSIFDKRYQSINQIFGGIHELTISKLFNEAIVTKKPVYSQSIEDNINSSIDFQLNFIPIVDKSEKVNFIFVLFEDVTETSNQIKNLENEAKELRTYQSIASTVLDAIIAFNDKGEITFWNNAATRVFGLNKIETYGKFIGNIIQDFSREYFKKIFETLRATNLFETKVRYYLHGISRTISIKMALAKEEELQSVVALCADITDRENLEKALRSSEETFRTIVTNTREYICTYTLDGKITYCNPYFIEKFGYSENELQGREIASLINLDELDSSNFKLTALAEDDVEVIELPLIKKNGQNIFVLANFTTVSDLQGKPHYYIAVFTDISDKKANEEKLKLIRSVFETATEGITLIQNGKITLANISFANMFGYATIEEILELNPLDFICEKDKIRATDDCKSTDATNRTLKFVYEGKKKSGETIILEKGLKRFYTSNTSYIIETYVDITEQQKAKRSLEESEERYRSITENIDDAIWTLEFNDGKVEKAFIAPSILEITQYADIEFEMDSKLWLRIIHPSDKQPVISKLQRVVKDKVRKQVELEYRIIDKYGSLVWVRNKLNFIRDDFGAIMKIFGLFSDITIDKKNEKRLQQTTDELKTLNESKDRFISIISHDLRTPFSSILGFTDILLMDDNISKEKQQQYIGFIQESAQNMLKLVNSILDWTRLQTGRIDYIAERLNIQEVVNGAIQMLTGSAMQKRLKLYSVIDDEIFVHGDKNMLLQVFNNLISNAIKFTNSDGEIFVSAEPLVDKKVIQFSVTDTGVGISEKDIYKLFSVDSKYTTDGTEGEKGSGLGLSLVKEIIVKHGGEITVESEIGIGTSFIFTIPISSTKILLVDDVQSDAILYKKLLNNILPNYQVEVAYDGVEGYEAVLKMMPALIITDHTMPKMSGFDMVRKLMHSNLKYTPPTIVLSSDVTDAIAKEYEELGIEYIFKKPVGLTVFKNAIEKSLQKALTPNMQ